MKREDACRRAVRTLSFGHFTRSATDHYVFCPECRTQVEATTFAWDKGAKVEKALNAELIGHLMAQH